MSENLEKKELETTEEVVEEVVEEKVEEVVEELPNLEEVKVELKCQKCGAALEEGQMFCPQCGKKVDETPVGKDVMATVTKLTDNIKDKVEEALKVCNKLNHGNITKFFVDEDGDVQCGADLFVCEENCAHACWIVLIKMLSDIDKVYPQFAKIKFS